MKPIIYSNNKNIFLITLLKILIGFLSLLIIDVPILDTWKSIAIVVLWLAIIFSDLNINKRSLVIALITIISIIVIKHNLPKANISEGHNVFKFIDDNEVLESGIPSKIFDNWKKQFNDLYPLNSNLDDNQQQWLESGFIPKSLYAKSSDSIWRKAKYSRQVDSINFSNLGNFRGGFANNSADNYWKGEMLREWMPFFVMYEFSKSSVGSSILWNGQAFWELEGGNYEEIVHKDLKQKKITINDVGKKIYLIFFPKLTNPKSASDNSGIVSLKLSSKLYFYYFAGELLTIIGLSLILFRVLRLKTANWAKVSIIFCLSYFLLTLFLSVSEGKYLGKEYPPHGGGDDGLVFDSWGREMAMLVKSGDIVEAMKGGESIYWFTPGTRYFRMVEKLIFGDTNHGYALISAFIPVLIYYLVSHFVGSAWAWRVLLLFLLIPSGGFSYLYLLILAKLGYGETLASFLYLLGLLLLLKIQPSWGGSYKYTFPVAWFSGFFLALSMFVRPNFSIAVVFLGGLYVLKTVFQKKYKFAMSFILGLSVALWMPFHNWFYGGEFYLISKSGSNLLITFNIFDYINVLVNYLQSGMVTPKGYELIEHTKAWAFNPGHVPHSSINWFSWLMLVVKLSGLLLLFWISLGVMRKTLENDKGLAIVSISTLLLFAPILFVMISEFTSQRYISLAWDLSVMILIIFLIKYAHAKLK
jgi:hypothetical protein